MAIQISSLSPVSPVIPAGSTVTFVVTAAESEPGRQLEYEWQFSINGGLSYTSSGLFNNTSDTFTTSPLSQNQSGIYFRVKVTSLTGSNVNEIVYSDEVPAIGDRIVTVVAAPSITTTAEYEPSYTVPVASTLNLVVSATMLNVDISNPSNLSGLNIEWQESSNNGDSWTTITPGTFGQFTYAITTELIQASSSPVAYVKQSTLSLQNITFASNNYQYRARITYSGASNSPTIVAPTTILVNPTISIIQQPGLNPNDTKVPVQCYKTSISNSGELRVSVGAFTTSGQTIAYAWEFSVIDFDGNASAWNTIQYGIDNFWFRYKTGTGGSTDVLELQRVIYFERIGFRVTISGSAGEVPVTSDPHYIYMKDIQVLPESLPNKESLEDFYDPEVVPNSERALYTQYPIQSVLYESFLNVARNTGLNGEITMTFQRQNPGSTTWSDVGISATYTPIYDVYTATPTDSIVPLEITYTTPPLRINLDNQARYRLKVLSTAVYTLSNNVKTLTPFYTSSSTLTIYRAIYITSQPSDITSYNNQPASFLVGATPTSTAPITYQWQDSTSSTTGWANIVNGGIYSGATTNLLTLSQVTSALTRRYFRCIVNTTNTLSSATSNTAQVNILRDVFSSVGSLNDYSVDEFDPISWTVEAQSLSLGAISYQWQKSTNFTSSNPSGATWTNIAGQTTNTYTIASVIKSADEGYYRCRLTSAGGEVTFTNAALLSINKVEIRIIQNIPTTLTFLEAAENERTFTVQAVASRGAAPTYQWQIRRVGDAAFSDLGLGYNGQQPTGSSYTPRAFDAVIDTGAKIRCAITAAEVPGVVYSNECTISVNRRFFYFADSATKNVNTGGNFALDLSPSSTGGTPTFQWQISTNNGSTWSNISGETSSTLFISNVSSSLNGYLYRCQVTLANCTQYQYSRNNVVFIDAASSVGFTQSVRLNVLAAAIKPRYYSKEIVKTGAAIGTVICVPKPAGYVNDPAATGDDITNWKVSLTGDITTNGSTSSTVTSGSIYSANKPSWVTDSNYRSPKWLINDDRFPGFIELRGQWVLKSDFPMLYRIIGDTYGSTSTLFKLPLPYGKKIMGTGNVNNNGGNVSIVPLYTPAGTLGGDKNEAGSIGGVWNYIRSAQLPPGSPGSTNQPDGTAGESNEETFSVGNFNTTGFTECEGVADTSFTGSFTFTVGPLLTANIVSVPPHSHIGIVAGFIEGYIADSGGCEGLGVINPPFYGVDSAGGEILDGPDGVPAEERGLPHSHGLSTAPIAAGNSSSNHNDGIGDTSASASITTTTAIQTTPGSSASSANVFLEPAPITLTNASRPIFNSSLRFYLRNNEELPVNSNYYRMKYMIKAY
jgi:hypothetical protein